MNKKQLLICVSVVFWAWVIGLYMGQKMESNFWKKDVGIQFEASADGFAVISVDKDMKIEVKKIDNKKIIRMEKE